MSCRELRSSVAVGRAQGQGKRSADRTGQDGYPLETEVVTSVSEWVIIELSYDNTRYSLMFQLQ